MQKSSSRWVAFAVIGLLVVGGAVYFGNTKLQKGSFGAIKKVRKVVNQAAQKAASEASKKPDLAIDSITKYQAPKNTWAVTIKNLGTECTNAAFVKVFATYNLPSKNNKWITLPTPEVHTFGQLCSGQTGTTHPLTFAEERFVFDSDSAMWVLGYLVNIQAIVDPDNAIQELNEANNNKSGI